MTSKLIRRVIQIGASKAVVLPQKVCEAQEIELGDHVAIEFKKMVPS